jgi:hypothetical protein
VLRLPAAPVRSLIWFASGVHGTLLGSCPAACACPPGRSEGAFRAGVIVQPATQLPACSHVNVSRISQVPRRSILCLCLGLAPRPNQRFLAYLSVSSMLPPLRGQRRLQRVSYFGLARLQHLLPTLQEWCCHHPCKARFRLAGLPLPGGSRTIWIALKGFRLHFHPLFLDFSWRYRDELRRVPRYRPICTAEIGKRGLIYRTGSFAKETQEFTVLRAAQQNVFIRQAICNVQGTCFSSHVPRTDPYVRLSRIRLPPQVSDGRAIARRLPYAFQLL